MKKAVLIIPSQTPLKQADDLAVARVLCMESIQLIPNNSMFSKLPFELILAQAFSDVLIHASLMHAPQ